MPRGDCADAPLVSVIIPTYNRGQLLTEALESVLSQSYRHFEILVVDDGSSDDTKALVAPYFGRIQYREQVNRGVAAARNLGVRHARGSLVCFLDSDDKWFPEKLERQVAFARTHPECGLIATEIAVFSEDGPVAGRSKAAMYEIEDGYVLERLLFSNWIQTSTVMIRREALERVGGFDEDVGQFGEDWLLWMRVAAEYPVHFLREPLVYYRLHQESLTSHRPELQYQSLMTILNRLASWPSFAGKQHLLDRARYRIAVGRGKANLETHAYSLAIAKLKQACAWKRMPLRAAGLLLRAQIESRLRPHRGATA